MKMAFLRNLQGTETLAKDIYDAYGKPLLKAGYRLDSTSIKSLKKVGVFLVYIEDSDLDDIVEDKFLKEFKKTSIDQLPTIFTDIVSKNYLSCNKLLDTVDEMVSYILSHDTINTSLYEVRTFDNYTYIHCIDTAIMAIYLGSALKFEEKKLQNLGNAGILHDIGKIKLPQELINKPTILLKEEYDLIKKHTTYGKHLLEETNMFPSCVIEGVAHHHEHFNGTGYPYGLKGNSISEFGRIISICDVFTAISANRSYRVRFMPNEAYEYILSGGGNLFDIAFVDVFRKTFAIYPLGCCVKLSNGIEGYVVKQNSNFPDRPILRVTYNHISREKLVPYEIDLVDNTNLIISSLVL